MAKLYPVAERRSIFPYRVMRRNEKTGRWLLVSDQPTKKDADALAAGLRSGHGWETKVFSHRSENPKRRAAKPVTRPSQATKKKPTKRLVARRKATLLGPAGYYANPEKDDKFRFHIQEKIGGAWKTLTKCANEDIAKWMATRYAARHPGNSFRVVKV